MYIFGTKQKLFNATYPLSPRRKVANSSMLIAKAIASTIASTIASVFCYCWVDVSRGTIGSHVSWIVPGPSPEHRINHHQDLMDLLSRHVACLITPCNRVTEFCGWCPFGSFGEALLALVRADAKCIPMMRRSRFYKSANMFAYAVTQRTGSPAKALTYVFFLGFDILCMEHVYI